MAVPTVAARLTPEQVEFLDWLALRNKSYRNTIARHLFTAAIEEEMFKHQNEFDAYRGGKTEKESEGG